MFEQLPRLSELDLVLLTEDFDRSLVLLARKLKWPLQDLLYIRVRESKPDQSKQELLDKVEAYLSRPLENMTENGKAFTKKCILKDQEIYNEAKEMFQKQLDALSHREVEKDVARLQSANQALEDLHAPKSRLRLSTQTGNRSWSASGGGTEGNAILLHFNGSQDPSFMQED